jgi:hypothetical protein
LRGSPRLEEDLAISMVLIESMLWPRFSIRGGDVDTSVHVSGAQRGDVVLVTGEAALRQIVDHRLAFGRAEHLGLVRLYGDAQELTRLRGSVQ